MGKVIVVLSVDWDADCPLDVFKASVKNDIRRFNLETTKIFKRTIPLTHFICPAFYLRKPSLESEYTAAINSCLRAEDEIGLHVHCWESLIKAALGDGQYKSLPSAFKTGEPQRTFDGVVDRGQGVPLGTYDVDQIVSIVNRANQLLGKLPLGSIANNGTIKSFRCGAWFTNDNVFEALKQCGFTHESSAVAVDELEEYATLAPMFLILKQLWRVDATRLAPVTFKNVERRRAFPKGVTLKSQPTRVADLIEVPNNGVLAEYTTSDRMEKHVLSAVSAVSAPVESAPPDTLYISLGFHHNNPNGWPGLLKTLEAIQSTHGKSVDFKITRQVRPIDELRGG